MRRIFAVAMGLIFASAFAVAYAQAPRPQNNKEALMRMEYAWAEGQMAKDIRAVGPILADDYVALGPSGEFETKAQVLSDMRYGVVEYTDIYTNPMTVHFFGNTAVVVGSDEETSSRMGLDTSGHYEWVDVFALRNGRWQVVASQETFTPPVTFEPEFDEPID